MLGAGPGVTVNGTGRGLEGRGDTPGADGVVSLARLWGGVVLGAGPGVMVNGTGPGLEGRGDTPGADGVVSLARGVGGGVGGKVFATCVSSGSVPSTKYSVMIPGAPGGPGRPVSRSTGTATTPSGAGKSWDSLPARAFRMKLIHMGSARRAPVSTGPSERFTSYPIQTPATRVGENPTNQTSVESELVPVFPASGRSRILARTPVPRSITPFITFVST